VHRSCLLLISKELRKGLPYKSRFAPREHKKPPQSEEGAD